MKFKKFASLALSTVMAVSMLAGCGETAADTTGGQAQSGTKPETTTTTSTKYLSMQSVKVIFTK